MSKQKESGSWTEEEPESKDPKKSATESLTCDARVSKEVSVTPPDQIQDLMKTVYNAAAAGEVETISNVLSGYSEDVIRQVLHVHLPYSWSPLVVAVQNGHRYIVKYFLEDRGKKVYEYDNVNQEVPDVTALSVAAKYGHEYIVQLLLEREANINQTDKRLRTALHEACQYGHQKIVQHLLQRGARTDIADAQNNTCLMVACAWNQAKVVELLLKAGVDPNQKSPDNRTALYVVAECNTVASAEELLKSQHLVSTKINGHSALIQAILCNSFNVAELLLDAPVMTRQEKYEGKKLWGAFCIASENCQDGYRHWKKAMEDKLKNPIEKLSVASHFPASDLLDIGESQTWEDLESRKSIYLNGLIECLVTFESILGHDQDAVRSTNLKICYALCHEGRYSEALRVWIRGWKVLVGVCRVQGFYDCVLHVLETSYDNNKAIELPLSEEILQLIVLETEQDSTKRDETECKIMAVIALIHYALIEVHNNDEKERLKRLVERLVRVHSLLDTSCPFLHCVIEFHKNVENSEFVFHPKLMELVVECGADFNAVDSLGNSPLHLVASYTTPKNARQAYSIANFLLRKNANVQIRNNDNQTFLDLISPEMRAHLQNLNPLSL